MFLSDDNSQSYQEDDIFKCMPFPKDMCSSSFFIPKKLNEITVKFFLAESILFPLESIQMTATLAANKNCVSVYETPGT